MARLITRHLGRVLWRAHSPPPVARGGGVASGRATHFLTHRTRVSPFLFPFKPMAAWLHLSMSKCILLTNFYHLLCQSIFLSAASGKIGEVFGEYYFNIQLSSSLLAKLPLVMSSWNSLHINTNFAETSMSTNNFQLVKEHTTTTSLILMFMLPFIVLRTQPSSL